jgi:hypothetical protein
LIDQEYANFYEEQGAHTHHVHSHHPWHRFWWVMRGFVGCNRQTGMWEKAFIGKWHYQNRVRDLPCSTLQVPKWSFGAAAGFILPAIPGRKTYAHFNAGLAGPNSDRHAFRFSSNGQDRPDTTFIVSPAAFIYTQLRLYLLTFQALVLWTGAPCPPPHLFFLF